MKKIYIACIMMFFLLFPLSAKAEGISNYYIEATVQANGDLKVKELFILEGSFNGFERIIDYKNSLTKKFDGTVNSLNGSSIYNGSGIEIHEVKTMKIREEGFENLYQEGDIFTLVTSANKGNYGKYTVSTTSTGKELLIYNPSSKGKRGFYIEYTISNLGIVHNDIAEIGWNLFSDELTESIEHLEARINIPNNQELLRAWGHGPLHGNITLNGTNQVVLTIEQLSARTAIDVRFVFDKNVLSNSTKTSYLNALDPIIEIETEKANKANAEREAYYKQLEEDAYKAVEKAEKSISRENYEYANSLVTLLKDGEVKNSLKHRLDLVLEKVEQKELIINIIGSSILGLWTIGLIFLLRHVYKKYDKEYTSSFNNQYYRDFPAEYGPATVGYLLHRNIQNQDLSASILDLIQKKKISFEEIPGKKEDYMFKKLITKEDTLSETEQALLDFLFYENETILLSTLKTKAKKNYETFIKKFTKWKTKAETEAKQENFYESNIGIRVKTALYCFLGLIVSIILLSIMTMPILPIIIIIISIISFIYALCFTKKTKKGNDHYKKWIALKNFMNDFGTMDTKELPEITLWEKYLVYAVTLGCATKLAKTMKIKVQELAPNDPTVTNTMFDIYYFDRITTFNRLINNTMNQAISSAYSAQSAATSSSSSGGGFGGGFSGGGGSFGGGGGGGRF